MCAAKKPAPKKKPPKKRVPSLETLVNRYLGRPPGWSRMSAEDQWAWDKMSGDLDWDGTKDPGFKKFLKDNGYKGKI